VKRPTQQKRQRDPGDRAIEHAAENPHRDFIEIVSGGSKKIENAQDKTGNSTADDRRGDQADNCARDERWRESADNSAHAP
jgi:hypothetical protein